MFRSYRPSVKHSYTIRIAYTTRRNNSESIFRTQNNQKKKLRSFAHFCARFADFLRPFAFFGFLRNGPKVPESAPKCRPNWVSESARIGCPNSVSESARIGCLIGECQHHACLALANEHSRSPTIRILLCSESRFWFAHGCGPCLRIMWLCYLWDDIWRILKISKNCASGLQWQPFKPLKVWHVFSNMW